MSSCGVDLAVQAVSVRVTELHALLDHVLEEMDQIGLLELRRLAVGPVPEFALGADDSVRAAAPRRAR